LKPAEGRRWIADDADCAEIRSIRGSGCGDQVSRSIRGSGDRGTEAEGVGRRMWFTWS
jgi:hypothetical protein